MRRACAAAALVFASCVGRQVGGFETTDLQARVVRPDGSPVASARAWLVRSRGDSDAAVVLDSGITDGAGLIRFAIPVGGTGGLGLDASSGDSLGIAPLEFSDADTARVTLRESHVVVVPVDSLGMVDCFVPGSHFASQPGPDRRTARLLLPSGNWKLSVRRGATLQVVPLRLEADTVVSGVSVPASMDTSAQAMVNVLAARTQSLGLDGIELDVVNNEPVPFDSLTVRFYLDGIASDMADFAVRLDLAQQLTSAGFSKPVPLDAKLWRRVVPVLVDPSCPSSSVCSWVVDLPLDGVTISVSEKLHASLVFDRHDLSSDSLEYLQSRPTHDPFSGSDWSFRPRAWADSAVAIPGMPDYGGVPMASQTTLPEVAPYIVLLRGNRLISGKPPSTRM